MGKLKWEGPKYNPESYRVKLRDGNGEGIRVQAKMVKEKKQEFERVRVKVTKYFDFFTSTWRACCRKG